ncbi:hypothetical protein Bca52824_002349 [Brassica carinata]|uniref:Uncharacterized protein n=1 Tax=Brassica carinata TaxID=52824 RepID=A0A8X7WHW9_BRACI|nr:hypothetical protein Bca52824_002349 [Brassica carinata]
MGAKVVQDKGIGESSDSGMAGAHDGDYSGKTSSCSGSEEEKDVLVVCQTSDVSKGEIVGVQVINGGNMVDYLSLLLMRLFKLKRRSIQVEAQNLVNVAGGTLVTSVYVKNPGNDSEVTPEGVAGKTESVDAPVCSKPVEPLIQALDKIENYSYWK